MSLTTNFVLLDRARFDKEVRPMIPEILAGGTENATRILRDRLPFVSSQLDAAPDVFFQQRVYWAIETLEGRLTEAFVNELSPVITDPATSWRHNVETHVLGGLALALCTERPARGFSPALTFWRQFSWVVRAESPITKDVADRDDPDLMEPTHTGIFQKPENFLRPRCLEQIASGMAPLIQRLSTLPESEQTIRSVQHFHELICAPLRDPELALLKGYV